MFKFWKFVIKILILSIGNNFPTTADMPWEFLGQWQIVEELNWYRILCLLCGFLSSDCIWVQYHCDSLSVFNMSSFVWTLNIQTLILDQKSKRNNVFGLHNHSIFLNNLIGSYSLPSIYCIFLYCRLMHLILLAFNYLSVKSLSTLSGGSQSVFSKKENAIAVLLVASQVSECAFELVTFPYRWQQTKDVLLFFFNFQKSYFLWTVMKCIFPPTL